jgi:hypothetical protein
LAAPVNPSVEIYEQWYGIWSIPSLRLKVQEWYNLSWNRKTSSLAPRMLPMSTRKLPTWTYLSDRLFLGPSTRLC